MVKSCWICKTEGNKLNKSYFRIPKTVFHRNHEISELSAWRKEKWRDVLLLPDDTSGIRICSDHFLSGNPARLLDVNDPDWIPTRNLKPKSVKKNKPLSVACEKADEITCRLCFKLVSKELCVNIFHDVNKKIGGMVATILGHKLALEEGPSPHACNSCLEKVRVCARLLTFFRRNEKRYLDSVQNNGMESPDENGPCVNEKNQVDNNKMTTFHAEGTRTDLKDETMENETGCDTSEDVLRIYSLFDHEQIRSIIEDNSVSSQEGLTETKSLKCKRRKYNIHSIVVRPIEMKTLKCNSCYSKFDDLDGLKNHKNFCKLFHCQLCKPQIMFTKKVELEKHKKKYHCHSLVCHICGKNYSQSYLVKHFKNHFEERRKCPLCSKTLKNRTIFMTHLDNVHGNKFSTVCEVCGGNFRNLKKHLVVCRKSGS